MIGQQTFLLDKWPRAKKFDQRHQTPFRSLRAWESGDETNSMLILFQLHADDGPYFFNLGSWLVNLNAVVYKDICKNC